MFSALKFLLTDSLTGAKTGTAGLRPVFEGSGPGRCAQRWELFYLSALGLFVPWPAPGSSQGQRQSPGLSCALSQPGSVALLKPWAIWGSWPTVTRCHFHYCHIPSQWSSSLQKFPAPADPVNIPVTLSRDRVSPWLPTGLVGSPPWILSVSCPCSLLWSRHMTVVTISLCGASMGCLALHQLSICTAITSVITSESAFRKQGGGTPTSSGPVAQGREAPCHCPAGADVPGMQSARATCGPAVTEKDNFNQSLCISQALGSSLLGVEVGHTLCWVIVLCPLPSGSMNQRQLRANRALQGDLGSRSTLGRACRRPTCNPGRENPKGRGVGLWEPSWPVWESAVWQCSRGVALPSALRGYSHLRAGPRIHWSSEQV